MRRPPAVEDRGRFSGHLAREGLCHNGHRRPPRRARRPGRRCLLGAAAVSLPIVALFSGIPGCAKSDSGDRAEADYGRGILDFARHRDQQAVHWLGQASARGNLAAEALLGRVYLAGQCVRPNYARALRLLRPAAARGDISAMRGLISAYRYGLGLKQNFAAARRWILDASKHGAPWALAELGKLYIYGRGVRRNPHTGFDLALAAAKRGSVEGAMVVALCYGHGWGVPKDAPAEISWLTRAAKAGMYKYVGPPGGCRGGSVTESAYTLIGRIYEHGNGVPRNARLAEAYYLRAIRLGSTLAMNDLGHLYEKLPGGPAERAKAIGLFQEAAARGSAAAAWNLAYCYQHGIGTRISMRLAAGWYKRERSLLRPRVIRGNRLAEYMLAMAFLTGVPRDPPRAMPLLGRLARTGEPQYEMLYGAAELRQGGTARHADGLRWLERAAKGGDSDALDILGDAYSYGLWGVQRSKKKAREFLAKAAAIKAELRDDGGGGYHHH